MKPILCAVVFACAATWAGGQTVYNVPTDGESRISIRLSTPLTAVPSFGFFPVKVSIENRSTRDGTWNFVFRSGQPAQNPGEVSTRTEFTVAAGQNRDFWVHVPVQSSGIAIVSPQQAARGGGMPGRPPAPAAPATVFPDQITAIGTLLRQELEAAGLTGSGSATSSVAPAEAGLSTVTVRIRQTSTTAFPAPADGPTVPGVQLDVGTDASGRHTRTLTYSEKLPTAWLGQGNRPDAAGMEAGARRLLEPTGLLRVPDTIDQAAFTPHFNLGRMVAVFRQTGPAADLPPVPAELPAGVIVSLHAAAAGAVTRTITYSDPISVASADTSTTVNAFDQGRFELVRRGFARIEQGVQISGVGQGPTGAATFAQNTNGRGGAGYNLRGASSGFNPMAAAGTGTVATITESGPATLITVPRPESLPPNTTVAMAGGARPGEAVRTFTVSVSPPAVRFIPGAALATRPVGSVNAEVTGTGLSVGRIPLMSQLYNGVAGTPPLAVSASIAGALRSKLALGGVAGTPSLAPLEPASLPADWRVWSSFHAVILAESDYAVLDAARRAALRNWVTMGGRLVIASDGTDNPPPGQVESIGTGTITILGEAIDEMDSGSMGDRLGIKALGSVLPDENATRQLDAGSIFDAFGNAAPASTTWVAGFIVCFAVLVGPVNLVFFAPLKRRYRLFLTTPLIAIAGTALLALIIVLQDGFGGSGVRDAVVILDPSNNSAVVFQTQFTRTGLVLDRSFALADDTLVSGVTVPKASSRIRSSYLSRSQGEADGDWYRSRSHQGYHLRRVVPTRGRLEVVGTAPDGAPIVQSSLETTLREFLHEDAAGRLWTAKEIPTGRRVQLTPLGPAPQRVSIQHIARGEWADWVSAHYKGTMHLADVLRRAGESGPGRWVALGSDSEIAPVATLSSLKWESSRVAFAGVIGGPR